MPGSLFPAAKQRFYDATGKPLVGGKVTTWAAGTSSKKTTFQDRALTSANTNPAILDARGEATMYGVGIYRVRVEAANGALIYDRDNVEVYGGVLDAIIVDIADVEAARAAAIVEINSDVATVDNRRIQAVNVDIPAILTGLAAFNERGAWVPGTAYALKDIYIASSIAYVVTLAHTSSTVADDLAVGKVAVHQGVTRADLAASSGSALIGRLRASTDAVSSALSLWADAQFVNLFEFLTKEQIADVKAGTLSLDCTAAINAALASLSQAGTATYGAVPKRSLYAPAGKYRHTAAIAIPKNTKISGDGKNSTIFASNHAGNGFTSIWPINSSTTVNIALENLAIWNTNGANIGAGFVDVGGTMVHFRLVQIFGFKFNMILDQTELSDFELCDFEFPLSGCVWLVNGADYTPGAQAFFTNRISISKSQFSAGAGVIGIIDDGGYLHAFDHNNYNGMQHHMRFAGVGGLTIFGGEFEGATGANIVFTNATWKSGSGVGQCQPVWIGGGAVIASTTGNASIAVSSLGAITLDGVQFAGTGTKFTGTAKARAIFASNVLNLSGGPTFDGRATVHIEDSEVERYSNVPTRIAQSYTVNTSQSYGTGFGGAGFPVNASLGNQFDVLFTGTSPISIAAPTNSKSGQRITIRAINTGGVMGAVTWSAVYKMAAWVNPANGFTRAIDFIYDGASWCEVGRTPSDIPN